MAAYQAGLERLTAIGARLVAVSTDDEEHARGTAAELGLTFPIGYGLPLLESASALGSYYETRRGILHATGFLVRPDQTIAVACYSSGAIGRLAIDDVIRLVEFYQRSR